MHLLVRCAIDIRELRQTPRLHTDGLRPQPFSGSSLPLITRLAACNSTLSIIESSLQDSVPSSWCIRSCKAANIPRDVLLRRDGHGAIGSLHGYTASLFERRWFDDCYMLDWPPQDEEYEGHNMAE